MEDSFNGTVCVFTCMKLNDHNRGFSNDFDGAQDSGRSIRQMTSENSLQQENTGAQTVMDMTYAKLVL